jgi:hypothetical protein
LTGHQALDLGMFFFLFLSSMQPCATVGSRMSAAVGYAWDGSRSVSAGHSLSEWTRPSDPTGPDSVRNVDRQYGTDLA